MLAISPFATISDAVDLLINSDGAALGDVIGGAPHDALLEHVGGRLAVVFAQTCVQATKVHAVLEGAVLKKAGGGNVGVVVGETHGEAEVLFGVRVEVRGA